MRLAALPGEKQGLTLAKDHLVLKEAFREWNLYALRIEHGETATKRWAKELKDCPRSEPILRQLDVLYQDFLKAAFDTWGMVIQEINNCFILKTSDS